MWGTFGERIDMHKKWRKESDKVMLFEKSDLIYRLKRGLFQLVFC